MAINYIEDDLTHICKTTSQWQTTTERYEIIPSGVLCIELCNDKLTKVKIGNGHLIYEQLPYVSAVDLNNYYTKEETDTIIKDLKCIKIKGEASSLSDLPLRGNKDGDLWFVKRQDPVTHNRYDEYIWYKDHWENWGSSDIDLSEYAKKSYVYELIKTIQKEINDLVETVHTHSNKSILDQTSAVYTTDKDQKLESLHNYDDTELRELIDEKTHTHSNKNILDQTNAVYNKEKDEKLYTLENYDDTEIRNQIQALQSIAHSHANKEILDRTTAAFTREQAITLLDCKDFTGTDGVNDGFHGFVPAPTSDDVNKVLGSNGQWVPASSTSLEEGDAISIEDNPSTDGKVVSVRYNDGLKINQNNQLEANLGDGLTIDSNNAITIDDENTTLFLYCVVDETI